MTPGMAKDAGVAGGSLIILYLKDGESPVEILPPATGEMKRAVEGSVDKFTGAFAEIKRPGD